MSCLLGFSVRPLTSWPFSSNAVCFVRLLLAECRSSTFLAIITPLALCQGPAPIRSRACVTFGSLKVDACVLK